MVDKGPVPGVPTVHSTTMYPSGYYTHYSGTTPYGQGKVKLTLKHCSIYVCLYIMS